MKQELELKIKACVLHEFGLIWEGNLERVRPEFGDYTCKVSWALARHQDGDVWHYAQVLATRMQKSSCVQIEAHPPGYLNFRYLPKFKAQEIAYLLKLKPKRIEGYAGDFSIDYALRRHTLVLAHLELPSSMSWPQAGLTIAEEACVSQLVKFRDYFHDLSSSKKRSDGLNYLKNLARTVHDIYNEITLVTDDVQKNQAVAAILHASQAALAQGLNLVGGNLK